MKDCTTIDSCIACGGDSLQSIFNLGLQPLANSYKTIKSKKDPLFPLGINYCENCFHVQLTHRVSPHLLFDDYAYTSGVSQTTIKFFEWFAKMSIELHGKTPTSILDIGCNDGSQLDIYKKLGLETFGVDPARNHYVNTIKNHNIVCEYFGSNSFNRTFDIITVQNAFAHNDDQFALLTNISPLMDDNSLLFAVTSQADMLVNSEFDTIYHEHLSFYNINSMKQLCERSKLNLVDVLKHPIHGNSYIFVISKTRENKEHIETLISQERNLGLYDCQIFENFKATVIETVDKIKELRSTCNNYGIPFIGYSAPAKSSTFLNYSKIKPNFIIDDTPGKQNTYSPGMSIPIYDNTAFNFINNHDTVCFIIFAWNFYEEIKEKILKQRPNKNDIFVRYFPKYNIE